MAYFTEDMLLPEPNRDNEEFWAGCTAHRLVIQRCARCGTYRHLPVPVCSECTSFEWEWVESSGRGEIFSYIIVPHGVHPATLGAVPYNAVIVQLDDCGGVKLTSNLINAANEDIHIGMPVRVAWEDVGEGVTLPRFEPA